MPYTTAIQHFGSYIKVTSSGTITSVEELFEYAALLSQKGEEYQTTRALLDARKLLDLTDCLDIYTLSESDITAEAAMRGVRVACLTGMTNPRHLNSFETIMQNRSFNFKNFTDEAKAIAWLTRGSDKMHP